MTEKEFFKKSFFAPLIFPLVAYIIALLFPPYSIVKEWAVFLIVSIILGGILYLVFLVIFYWWQQDKNGKQVRQFTYAAPFIFTVIFVVLLFLVAILSEMVSIEIFTNEVFILSTYTLLTSSGYVLATNIVFYIFKFSGMIPLQENGSAA